MVLLRRYCSQYDIDNGYCDSAWDNWGRWVAASVILGIGVFAFLLIACINARRRRRRGLEPFTGTAWMAGPPPPYQQYQPPPPQYYSGPPQGPPPDSYYGARPQRENIELGQSPPIREPQNVYYQPPPGPPPNKPKV